MGKSAGKARGKANGEAWQGKPRIRGRGNGHARGRLGKVPRAKRSELGRHFGSVVRAELLRQGYCQRGLAQLAGISDGSMSALLKGRHSLRLDTAERVADALGYEVEALLARARRRMESGPMAGAGSNGSIWNP